MRYEIILTNPFNGEKMLITLPIDVIGISRPDGEKFISVSGFGGTFDVKGQPYTPIHRNFEG